MKTTPMSNDTEYPMQPIYLDKDQRPRFEKNPIVDMLCEKHGLNDIAWWWFENNVEQRYIEQFYQLIGYSVSGYGTLSQVSDESYYRATEVAADIGIEEKDALLVEVDALKDELEKKKAELEHIKSHFLQKLLKAR